MVLGKNVAIFYWEWGRNLAPGEGQKMSCNMIIMNVLYDLSPIFGL